MDIDKVDSFMAGHARLLDRRRFELMMGRGGRAATLAALEGYRNADGGYGWGLEPDLRSPESQPGAALHAFEVFEVAPSPRAAELCDWLQTVTLPDGGLPFALPLTVTEATAPWWQGADPSVSSLQITAVTTAAAWRVAAHDAAVAAHPWLARATGYCLEAIAGLKERPHAYVLAFAVRFLDTQPGASDLLDRLREFVPPHGELHVEGGTEHEMLRPLDFSPAPGLPSRELFTPESVAADLDRLESLQEADGGWTVDYATISPAGALDWRGATTVNALEILRRNGRLG
ncbi:hypothetical protein [Nonomuraea africana]|uniref:Uncharacterized protein n=1 Tax=Nonomuraea africana TaxID=46171 RepID=A0ABR9KD04_9ACTN|nr:hypothetical protein [Nonomuraea africana]MBE1559889.1 hypothetical protein [Nonomuraea africana]